MTTTKQNKQVDVEKNTSFNVIVSITLFLFVYCFGKNFDFDIALIKIIIDNTGYISYCIYLCSVHDREVLGIINGSCIQS